MIVELNRVIIGDANLPFSTNVFLAKFADCVISSLINFFSGNDQVQLNNESRNQTGFMTFMSLIRIIFLLQGATNSVVKFVKIALKIFGNYLCNRALLFFTQ